MPVLVLLFLVVPLAELFLLIQIGSAIGALPTIGILVADSILGAVLLKSQSRAVWGRFNTAVAAGRPPAREVIDGALVIMGGALLITPGFLSDLLGLLLLLPPTRAIVRRVLVRNFAGRMVAGFASGAIRARRGPGRPAYDYEGTAVDADPPPRPRLP